MKEVRLSTVVLSHLNDVLYNAQQLTPIAPEQMIRLELVKALTFLNPDLNTRVDHKYLDFMAEEIYSNTSWGCSYETWLEKFSNTQPA